MSNNLQIPSFKHPEIAVLYEHDLSIPKEKIATILELPRATLIEDLKTILADCIDRHDYFETNKEEDVWLEMHTHALWLLIELKAEEALPDVFNLLQQDRDFGDAWFGDSITEDYWQILYVLGGNALDELKTFLLKSGEWTHRAAASTAVEQIAFHQPERRAEVLEWYRSILERFLDMEEGDPCITAELIASMIGDLINLEAKEFLPLIKKLDDKGRVRHLFVGSYKDIKQDINSSSLYGKRDFFSSIYDRYHDAMTTWHGYRVKYDETYQKGGSGRKHNVEEILADMMSDPFLTDDFEQREQVVKIGRNEPCPCGSGKKYKKCCLRK